MDVKRMYCMTEKLAECAEKQFDAGIENIDTAEMGQVVDMMKDLSEAMYYRELTKAMQEFDAEDVMEMLDHYGDGRKFYDHYRYADGRFAPKGRGTYRRGYEEPPYYHMTPEMYRNMEQYGIWTEVLAECIIQSHLWVLTPVVTWRAGMIWQNAIIPRVKNFTVAIRQKTRNTK